MRQNETSIGRRFVASADEKAALGEQAKSARRRLLDFGRPPNAVHNCYKTERD